MTKLEKIQSISKVLRYVVITTAVCIFTYVAVGLLFFGQWWAAIGNSEFNQLWGSQTISHGLLGVVIAPAIIIVLLDVYWLQRLFGSYQRAEFFTDNSMRCYLWLVWLKVASFAYGICWPLIVNAFRGHDIEGSLEISINISTFFTLLLLVVIVHLLKEAQSISNENKGFV